MATRTVERTQLSGEELWHLSRTRDILGREAARTRTQTELKVDWKMMRQMGMMATAANNELGLGVDLKRARATYGREVNNAVHGDMMGHRDKKGHIGGRHAMPIQSRNRACEVHHIGTINTMMIVSIMPAVSKSRMCMTSGNVVSPVG